MNGQPRSILSENGEWILSAIKRNPEGLLLLAAGAALLLRTSGRPPGAARSMAAAYGADHADHHAPGTTTAPSAVRQTIDAASDVARQTADTAASYASAASDYADRARRSVSDQSDRIARQTQSMARNVLQRPATHDRGRGNCGRRRGCSDVSPNRLGERQSRPDRR